MRTPHPLPFAIISMPLAQPTFSMSSSYSNPPLHTTNQPVSVDASQRSNSRNPDALRRFTYMLLLWLTIFGSIISIAWLILKPQAPDFGVNALPTVSNFELSSSQIQGKYDVKIFIRNPNKKLNLYLSNFKIVVLYRRNRLCKTYSLASLSLEKNKMKQTTLSAQLQSDLGCPVKAKELKNLVRKLNSGVTQMVNFDLEMSVSTTFSDGKWLQVKRSIDVYCKNLNIIFLSSKQTGKSKEKRQSCVVSSLY
jgi:hypothetical protein